MKKTLLSIMLVLVFSLALVSAATVGDATVTFSDTSESGNPADTVTFTVSLTNTNTTDSTTVSFSSTALTDASSNTITAPSISDVTLSASETKDTTFDVTIPSTAAGDYTGTLTVTSGSDSTDFSYTVTVNSLDSQSVDVSSITVDVQTDDVVDETFVVTNDGSTTLTAFDIFFESDDGDIGKIEDEDGDEILVTFSGEETELAPGESMTVTVDFDVENDVDVDGNYDGTIYVESTGSSGDLSSSISVDVAITPAICENGKQGSDFDISIKEPDSGDDFKPGETISVEFEVENNANDDLDIEVEVILYNENDDNKEKVVKEDFSIDEDETEDYQIDIEVPTDLDESDSFVIYVQVHEDGNEDDSCDFETVDVDLERENEDAKIVDVSVSPTTGLVCGEDYRVSIEVESTGDNDIDDLYIELVDGDLDVSKSSPSFDLGDYNDNDNDYKQTFDLTVPADLTAGVYYLEATLFDDSGDRLDDELIAVDIDACGSSSTTTTSGDDSLGVTLSDSYDVNEDELTVALVVENNGDNSKTIDVEVEGVSWASVDGIEHVETLGAGDSSYAYVYLDLDMTTTGKHDITITISDSEGNEISEIVTVDFGDVAGEEPSDSFFEGWFEGQSASKTVFWVITDIILVILALVFLRMLFSKR